MIWRAKGGNPPVPGRPACLLSREVSAGEVPPAIPAVGSRGARAALGSAGRLGRRRPRLARCRTRTGHRVALAVRAAGGGGRGAFVCAGAARGGSAGSTGGNAGGNGTPGETRLPPYPSLQLLGGQSGSSPQTFPGSLGEAFLRAAGKSRRERKEEVAFREAGKLSWAQHIAWNSLKQQGNFGQPKLSLEPRKRGSGLLHLPSRAARNGLPEK